MNNLPLDELLLLQTTIQHLPANLRTAIREQTPLSETEQAAIFLEVCRPGFEGRKQERTITDALKQLQEHPQAPAALITDIDYLLGANFERLINERKLPEGERYIKIHILKTPAHKVITEDTGQYIAEIYQ